MRRFAVAIIIVALFIVAVRPVQAKSPKIGPGIPGTVTSMSDRYFIMDSPRFDRPVKVYVSANTNFQDHGRASDATHVKVGVQVRVTGSITSEYVIESWKVNVVGG